MKKFGILLLLLSVVVFFGCAGKQATCSNDFVQVPPAAKKAPAPPAMPRAAVEPAPVVKKVDPAPIVLYFDFNKADIKASEQSKIDQIVDLMKKDPTSTANIEGHADPIGKPPYNMAISHQRAMAVRAALASRGIDPKRILSLAYGSTKLAKEGLKDKAANEVNRRAVVTIKLQ